MQSIQSILNSQPRVDNQVLSSTGFCIWLCWSNGPEPKMQELIEASGGLEIANDDTQSLWFFFSVETILYALAKVGVWGKQYSVGASAFAFPCDLIVGAERVISLHIDPEFLQITCDDPNNTMFIVAHPKIWPGATKLPGVSSFAMPELEKQGLFDWKIITADRQLQFSMDLGWFGFLHPLGNPLDKQYQKGWGKIFEDIEPLLEEKKIKYALHGGFLSAYLTSIDQLKAWVRQVLVIFEDIREHHQDLYWPCVSFIADKKNMNFLPEIHEKLNIAWNELSPDTPHLSYKNAFFLGKAFTVRDINFSSTATDINVLCTVSLREFEIDHPTLSPLIAKALTPAKESCFYCGSGYHEVSACPTKFLEPLAPDFWKTFNNFDFEDLNSSYRAIDSEVNEKGLQAYAFLLGKGGSTAQTLRATFAINSSCQIPNVERIWQVMSRDLDEIPEENQVIKASPATLLLRRLTSPSQDLNAIERDCLAQLSKSQKNWHLHCVRGFIAMEKKNYSQAISAWKDAESLCSTTQHQAWLKYLVARLREVQGYYQDAFSIYTAAKSLLPAWEDLDYRILVARVKMGFGQVVSNTFTQQVLKSPEIFHKIILDPELVRGHHHINKQLFPLWEFAYSKFEADYKKLEILLGALSKWFASDSDHAILAKAKQIKTFLEYGNIKNYLLFIDVAEFRPAFEVELATAIETEVKDLKEKYETCLNKVEYVRDEMNWFHFQRSLVDFNSTFNDCARILNWAFVSNFNDVDVFKQAREQLPELERLVQMLKAKLNRLRMVRDVTLFFLLLLKSFLRVGSVLTVLAIVLIFGLLFFGDSVGMSWSQNLIKLNFWRLLKVVMSITLMSSLAFASLKTTIIFEKKRNELLREAKAERIKIQMQRIAKAKKIREEHEAAIKKKIREEADGEPKQMKQARKAANAI